MKVMLVSDVDVESGRGPVTRLAAVLPHLNSLLEVSVATLGEPDQTCATSMRASGIRRYPIAFVLDGWRVRDLPAVVSEILHAARRERPQLVVLYREIWDLMRELPPALSELGIPMLVMPHSLPFLDALPRPGRWFALDLIRQVLRERRPHARRYIIRNAHQVRLMRQLPRIIINETVDTYLEHYFPGAETVRAFPGYAVDTAAIARSAAVPKRYDIAFMAKLTTGKGLFDLLAAAAILRRDHPDLSVIVIGSFEDDRVRQRFMAARSRLRLDDAVELAGWLTGEAKYQALGSARVFCYPSVSADTFSFCLLEALSCGLPAVCYDVPFTRAVYGATPAVARAPFRQPAAVAARVSYLLRDERWRQTEPAARAFAAEYSSWERVAAAECAAYREFLAGGTRQRDIDRNAPKIHDN